MYVIHKIYLFSHYIYIWDKAYVLIFNFLELEKSRIEFGHCQQCDHSKSEEQSNEPHSLLYRDNPLILIYNKISIPNIYTKLVNNLMTLIYIKYLYRYTKIYQIAKQLHDSYLYQISIPNIYTKLLNNFMTPIYIKFGLVCICCDISELKQIC